MSQATSGPVSPTTLQDRIALCRRPFTAAAVKWKIQTNPKDADERKRAAVVAFIDARLAGERLNYAGLLWSTKYAPVPGGLLCTITVRNHDGEMVVERSDVGWSRGTGDNMTLKTLYSDSLKRAAVHFGVGVSIYALPVKYLSGADDEIVKRGNNWYITRKGEQALAAHYEQWLERHGVPTFGEVIDHGDMDGAQGDLELEERANEEIVAEAARPRKAAQPQKAAETVEPETGAEESEAPRDELVSPEQVATLIELHMQGPKTIDEVKTFLASKGVEDASVFGTADMETAFGSLTVELGRKLGQWLVKSRKAAEKAEAGS